MVWKPLYHPVGPKRLEETLDQVTSQLKVPRAQVLGVIFQQWEKMVGSVMASHTSPVRLVEGELVVTVDDPAWATEMRFFGAEIIERINNIANEEAVVCLTIKVRPQ